MRNSLLQLSCVGLMLVAVPNRKLWAQPSLPDCASDSVCLTLYENATQASSAGKLSDAERLYKLAYKTRADARLLFSIARVIHKLDRPREAASYYQQFIDSPLDDPEQKAKAQQYLEQTRREALASVSRPDSQHPAKKSSAVVSGSETTVEPSTLLWAGRPPWRLIAGGISVGAGLLLTGFGGSALAAAGSCVDVPNPPAQTCDRVYATRGVGGGLLGTGIAAVVGGVLLIAWPGK